MISNWVGYVYSSVRSHYSKTAQPNFTNFCECCLWPWLDTLLVALRYVMYFRFCGWRLVFIPWDQWATIKHDVIFRRSSPGGGTSWTSRQLGLQCLVEFIRMRHRGRSLLSTIDLLLRDKGFESQSSYHAKIVLFCNGLLNCKLDLWNSLKTL